MDKKPTRWAAEAIKILGGPTNAARLISEAAADSGTAGPISRQSVEYWVRGRVPAEYCPLVERQTKGAVLCENLRPDIEWAVLRA